MRREGMTTALLSGRQNKLKEAFTDYREGGVYKWLFGVTRNVARWQLRRATRT